jgi:hypothetical protein
MDSAEGKAKRTDNIYFSGVITPDEDNTRIAVLSTIGWIIYSRAATVSQ